MSCFLFLQNERSETTIELYAVWYGMECYGMLRLGIGTVSDPGDRVWYSTVWYAIVGNWHAICPFDQVWYDIW